MLAGFRVVAFQIECAGDAVMSLEGLRIAVEDLAIQRDRRILLTAVVQP